MPPATAAPRATPDVALLAAPRSFRSGVLTAMAGGDIPLVRALRLDLTMTVDLDLSRIQFAFVSAAGERVVLSPWPVRPGARLGVTW